MEPVPHDVRRRVVGPPPRDDGRAARSTRSATRTSRSSATCEQPKAQLLGIRGAPGNTINHTTSYWIPNHSTRVFVPKVDVVSGVGYDRAAELGECGAARTTSCRASSPTSRVLDFETPDHRMRLGRVHPGVTVDEVVAATGFELVVDGDVPETPAADRRGAAR